MGGPHRIILQGVCKRNILMAKHTVVTMPGDGIGNQVLPEALRVLKAVGFEAGRLMPTLVRIGAMKATRCRIEPLSCSRSTSSACSEPLLPSPTRKEGELKPELRGKGLVYYSPIVTMRQKLNLDICMRPCIGFIGNPLNYIPSAPMADSTSPRLTPRYSARGPRVCTRAWSGRILRKTCARR